MTREATEAGGFAQLHLSLYLASRPSEDTILADVRKHTWIRTGDVRDALAKLMCIDSRCLGGDDNDFLVLHRLQDVYALRWVRNEVVGAAGWSPWPSDPDNSQPPPVSSSFGGASLLQCEM